MRPGTARRLPARPEKDSRVMSTAGTRDCEPAYSQDAPSRSYINLSILFASTLCRIVNVRSDVNTRSASDAHSPKRRTSGTTPHRCIGTQPQGDVGWLHRLPYHTHEIVIQSLKGGLVPELDGERFDGFPGLILASIEAPVYEAPVWRASRE